MSELELQSTDIQLQRQAKLRKPRLKKFLLENAMVHETVNVETLLKGLKQTFMKLKSLKSTQQYFNGHRDSIPINELMNHIHFLELDMQGMLIVHIGAQEYQPSMETISQPDTTTNRDAPSNYKPGYQRPKNLMNPANASRPGTSSGMKHINSVGDYDPTKTIDNGDISPIAQIRPNTGNQAGRARSQSVNPKQKASFRYGYVFEPYKKNLQSPEHGLLPRAKNVKQELYLYHQNDFKNQPSLQEGLIACQRTMADYRYLFTLIQIHMNLDPGNTGYVPIGKFIDGTVGIRRVLTDEVISIVANSCSEIVNGEKMVVLTKLTTLTDQYKFAPKQTETMKHKNNSEQFNNLALKRVPFASAKESTLQDHYIFLREKLSEKSTKLSEILRFFDHDHDHKIDFAEFKPGLDNLQMRVDMETAAALFRMIDKKNDNYIDMGEICEYIDFDVAPVVPRTANAFHWTPNPYVKMINSTAPRPHLLEGVDVDPNDEDCTNPVVTQIRHRNNVVKKTPVGKAKTRGYSLPSSESASFCYGVHSKPTENMKDIMSNNYQAEWFNLTMEKEKQRSRENSLNSTRRSNTESNIMRQHFIKKTREAEANFTESNWKLKRFSRTPSKVREMSSRGRDDGNRSTSRPRTALSKALTVEGLNRTIV